MRLKQLRKIFKKPTLLEADQVPLQTVDEAICNNNLQLKVVNVSVIISTSISDLGRVPGPASYKYGISCKFL